MRRGPPWAVIGAADYDFDQCRLAARSGRMRESFAADGNDLAGHQGGDICGRDFCVSSAGVGYRNRLHGFGSLPGCGRSVGGTSRTFVQKRLRVAQTTCRLDFSSTRSLGRGFPAAAWEGSSGDDTRHSVARRCSTGSGGEGKVGPAASIPEKETRTMWTEH